MLFVALRVSLVEGFVALSVSLVKGLGRVRVAVSSSSHEYMRIHSKRSPLPAPLSPPATEIVVALLRRSGGKAIEREQ